MITGVSGSPAYSRMRRSISFRWTPVIAASRSSSSSRACWFFGRSAGQSSMLVPSVFLTSTRPSRSRISPRCASIGSLRTRLLFACARYLSPERTCSAQRRRNSTAKIVSARKPSTATRSASCGVSRYGSSTRGSPGRKRERSLAVMTVTPFLSGRRKPSRTRTQGGRVPESTWPTEDAVMRRFAAGQADNGSCGRGR